MTEKHCLKCTHCRIDCGCPDWSDETPGGDPEMYCEKGHWRLEKFAYGREKMFAAFEKAKTCPDYVEETNP